MRKRSSNGATEVDHELRSLVKVIISVLGNLKQSPVVVMYVAESHRGAIEITRSHL